MERPSRARRASSSFELLAQGERTVEALGHEAGPSLANASQHLQVLRTARLGDRRLAEVERLVRRIAELPADKEVVAYCRGPYCVMAFEAVELLRARGRRARRLVEGFPEWRAAGLPVEAGGLAQASRLGLSRPLSSA